MNYNSFSLNRKQFLILDSLLLLPFLIAPLILDLPFRLNIFLSWEGAYRLFLGQIPYKDFGIPMGFGYWLVPTGFFYLFGPFMASLIKAQVLLNAAMFFSVRGILLKLSVERIVVSISLLVLCLTYIVFNFWPWYNNSVIVFELVSIYFSVSYFLSKRKFDFYLVASVLFSFLAFFTKQDAGALAILLTGFLVLIKSYNTRSVLPLAYFSIMLLALATFVILPFVEHDFLYWFNYGQFPHSSRISFLKIVDYLMYDIGSEKIFLTIIIFILLFYNESRERLKKDLKLQILFLVTIVLTLQVVVIRNTSPLGNDFTYFYGFVIALIFSLLNFFRIKPNRSLLVLKVVIVIGLLFSSGYWKYVGAYFNKHGSSGIAIHKEPWKTTSYKSLSNIKLPKSTINGMKRLELSFKDRTDLKVLNMSELTFLAYEFGYTPLTQQPLWYHLNVGIFDKEVEELSDKIRNNYYDVVLFEDIPSLNNFYPYSLRDDLKLYYTKKDQFLAPRKLEDSYIEVYVKTVL